MKTTTSRVDSEPSRIFPASPRLIGPDWRFPLERPHLGALLGNTDVGAMVWGEGRILRVTLGRPDVWDHSGGSAFTSEQTYANIRATLESGDADRLQALFKSSESRPTVVPLGRVEFDLGVGDVSIPPSSISPPAHWISASRKAAAPSPSAWSWTSRPVPCTSPGPAS